MFQTRRLTGGLIKCRLARDEDDLLMRQRFLAFGSNVTASAEDKHIDEDLKLLWQKPLTEIRNARNYSLILRTLNRKK